MDSVGDKTIFKALYLALYIYGCLTQLASCVRLCSVGGCSVLSWTGDDQPRVFGESLATGLPEG